MASGFGDMGSLLKQAQEMQKRVQEAEAALDAATVEGAAGGGAVKVVLSGNQDVQSVSIDQAAVDPGDVAGLEDLVTVAFKQAIEAAKQLRQDEMSKVTGGLNLPGMGF